MSFQPGASLYTQGFGTRPENVEVPTLQPKAPVATDTNWPLGKRWIDTVGLNAYTLVGLSSIGGVLLATWGSGQINSILGTVNQIAASTTAGVSTLSIPSTFTAPGSVITTTSLTSNLGNITASNGNFVALTAGTGLILNSSTASGTTTATLNGRSGQVTITTPSIAAGATFSFAITNSSVTASTTQILYSLTGGTSGSSLSIQSVTNSAGTSIIVIMNGTGATTNVSSLVLTFLVLN